MGFGAPRRWFDLSAWPDSQPTRDAGRRCEQDDLHPGVFAAGDIERGQSQSSGPPTGAMQLREGIVI
jgi:hypothetical protein